MLIDSINLNHVRIFECVYRAKSMTLAATELHLTQSGVSQHIKSLEEMLGLPLFDRIKQRLVPTQAASELFRSWSKSLGDIDQAISVLKGDSLKLRGTVSIGLPIEFGNNVILPLLAAFGRQHPGVKFKIRLGFVSAMNRELLDGNLDFAFVDDFGRDRQISHQKVYDEVLTLCASEELVREHLKGPGKKAEKDSLKFYESLPYVEYEESETVLREWFSHHLGAKKPSLQVHATVMDVQGVAHLILSGLGAGVLPSHLLSKLQREGKRFHVFKNSAKPLINTISIATLKERTQSPAAMATLEALRKGLSQSSKEL